jgi:hypothetical protein
LSTNKQHCLSQEFLFAPGGVAPTLNAPPLVIVSSLSALAIASDLDKEETNFRNF